MKRFAYRLETVLDYKTQVLDNLKTEHAAIMQNVNRKQEQIRGLKRELTGYESGFDQIKTEGATIENYRLFDMCIGRMETIIDEEKERLSVLMIVDANDPDKVRTMLEKQMDDMIARHDEAAGLYEKASSYCPAFGMVGTLVGLINMLKGMDLEGGGGASTLGQDMSVALITTFYGSLFANLFFQPIAKKLRVRQAEEELYCMTVIEGIMGIQAGENPKFLREHLLSCLKQSQQKKLLLKAGDASGSSEGGGAA